MTYEDLGAEIGRLVIEKQKHYGDSFGKAGEVMRVLYPEGVPLEKLEDALTVVRVIDKLFRIATDRDALGESPWRDIVGYGLLAAARTQRGRGEVTCDHQGIGQPGCKICDPSTKPPRCLQCRESQREADPAFSEGVCCFCGYWQVPPGPDREDLRRRRGASDGGALWGTARPHSEPPGVVR